MKVESVQLKNFRNYEKLELAFDPGINILFGDNAQGKTNILEAIGLCATSRSHRGSKDREMIRFGEDEAHIRLQVSKADMPWRIDIHLKKNGAKGVAVNGIPIRKARELMGILNIVLFSPEDLSIIKEGPSERRRFVDMMLCQLDALYLSDLSSYSRALAQRNKLLKDVSFAPALLDTLDVWDEQLVRFGGSIIEKRRLFFNGLRPALSDIHNRLSHGEEALELDYEENVGCEDFASELKKSRDRDIRMKMSFVGPHRDDFCVKANGRDLRKFGSQGQQRTAALSLKLSEIGLVVDKTGEKPVLLLDDVLSELDRGRQNSLLENIRDIQTIVTCTGLNDLVSSQFEINKVFHISEGKALKFSTSQRAKP